MAECPVVEPLPWDSKFFGLPVGRVLLDPGQNTSAGILEALQKSGNELTYVFLPVDGESDGSTAMLRQSLVGMGGKCCDLKVTYRKQIAINSSIISTECEAATQLTPALKSLAYASGWCSRFVVDEKLQPYFKPMYLIWLKRDFERGKVFVKFSGAVLEGMATVSVDASGLGRIGLVAVDAKCCGKGIGTLLLNSIDQYLARQGVSQCEVVTQGKNLSACRLYEKVGFKVFSHCEVWHVWNNGCKHSFGR